MAEKWIDTINITGAPYGNLYMEEERVKTYTHWPLDTQGFTMTMALAKSGFFYTGLCDCVSFCCTVYVFYCKYAMTGILMRCVNQTSHEVFSNIIFLVNGTFLNVFYSSVVFCNMNYMLRHHFIMHSAEY